MGPFELIDLIGLDVNLSVARSFYAQGGEPERWRPSAIQERLVGEGLLGRKSGQWLLRLRRQGRPIAQHDPELGIVAPTLDPAQLAKIDPAAAEIVPRLFAQIANEATFALEEEVGSPRRHGHRDAARLQLAAGAAGAHRADRRRAAPWSCSSARRRARRGLPARPRPARRRPRGLSVGSGRRKQATEHTAARNRAARGALPPDDVVEQDEARRGLVATLRPGADRARETAASSGSWSPTTSSTTRSAPDTAHPSLWRQSRLNRIAGLFELAPGLLPAARLRPLEHARGRGRARASSSSTRWSRPRPPRRRWPSTASTAASGRSPG